LTSFMEDPLRMRRKFNDVIYENAPFKNGKFFDVIYGRPITHAQKI
jgi:hypothetical protein